MNKYDVIILGAGPGGYKAAENLAKKGKKVALIERDLLGGTCLNRGCIPLKSFLHIAKAQDDFNICVKKEIFTNGINEFNMQGLLHYKNRVVSDLRKGLESKLAYYKIDIIRGSGKIIEKSEEGLFQILVNDSDLLQSEKLILAMGSEPMTIFSKHNENFVVNSDYMLDIYQLPKSILIIGAGVIGLEMASFLNSFGTEVTIVEMNDILGTNTDCEISAVLHKMLQRNGIKIHLNTKVDKIENKQVICNNGELTFEPELVLEAIGRKPVFNTDELDIIKVAYTNKGIIVDENCETTAKGVYACGDVTGSWMLAHAAYLEADITTEHILGKTKELDYNKVPMVLYTHPEVAWVGETEETCREKNISYKKISIPMSYSGRYMVENGKDNAIFKIIYASDSKKILGAHMIGNYSSEIILALETMLYNNMTLENLKDLVYPHPTVGEIIIQAIEFTED